MSNIKTYKAKASWFNEAEITIQVDHSILTPALAKEINDFWSDASWRLMQESQDVVRTVIRMFSARAIALAMEQGWSFSSHSYERGLQNAEDVIDSFGEGWPKAEELGISITDVEAEGVSFDDVELEAA